MTENDLLTGVLDMLRVYGWRSLHVRPARTAQGWRTPVSGDGIGYPDLFAVRGSRLIGAELKSDTGRLTPEQIGWLDALRATALEVYVWRPSDYPDRIGEVLR